MVQNTSKVDIMHTIDFVNGLWGKGIMELKGARSASAMQAQCKLALAGPLSVQLEVHDMRQKVVLWDDYAEDVSHLLPLPVERGLEGPDGSLPLCLDPERERISDASSGDKFQEDIAGL